MKLFVAAAVIASAQAAPSYFTDLASKASKTSFQLADDALAAGKAQALNAVETKKENFKNAALEYAEAQPIKEYVESHVNEFETQALAAAADAKAKIKAFGESAEIDFPSLEGNYGKIVEDIEAAIDAVENYDFDAKHDELIGEAVAAAKAAVGAAKDILESVGFSSEEAEQVVEVIESA